MSHSDPQCCKARMESLLGSLAPGNIFPRARRQRLRQLFHGNGLMVFVPAQQCWRASPPFPPLRGQRSFSRSPDGRGFLNTDDILQTQFGEPFSKLTIVAIGGIGQHGSRCDFFLYRLPNLLKRDRRLGGKGDLSRNARLLAALPEPKSLAGTGATRSGDWPVRWLMTNSLLPDNFLACLPVHSTDARRQRSEFLSWGNPCRPRSKPRQVRFASSSAAPSGAPFPAGPHHSTVRWLQNDGGIGARAAHHGEPNARPKAQYFCVHREVADRCNRTAEVSHDPRALRPAPGCPDKPQSVVVARLAPKKRRSCPQIISPERNSQIKK